MNTNIPKNNVCLGIRLLKCIFYKIPLPNQIQTIPAYQKDTTTYIPISNDVLNLFYIKVYHLT